MAVMRCLGASPTPGEVQRHLHLHKIGESGAAEGTELGYGQKKLMSTSKLSYLVLAGVFALLFFVFFFGVKIQCFSTQETICKEEEAGCRPGTFLLRGEAAQALQHSQEQSPKPSPKALLANGANAATDRSSAIKKASGAGKASCGCFGKLGRTQEGVRAGWGLQHRAPHKECALVLPERNAELDFSTFLNIMYRQTKQEEPEKEIITALSMIDRQKRGVIAISELRAKLTNLGEKLSEEEGISPHRDVVCGSVCS